MMKRTKILKYLSMPALCLAMSLPVFAEELPSGSVQGLPKNLIVCDSEGNSVSASGEYYIHVKDMEPNVLYTKDISIMNLRNDAVYRVYMSAAPNHTEGTIDLENEIECKLYLDGEQIYEGNVNGDGTPNMQMRAIDLGGVYQSGETRLLHAEFIWNITDETREFIENISTGKEFGAVDFDWIFSASVRNSDSSSTDDGGSSNSSSTNSGKGANSSPIKSRHGRSSSLNPPDEADGGTDENKGNNNDNNDNNENSGNRNDNNSGGTVGGKDESSRDGDDGDDRDDGDDSQGGIIDTIANNLPFIPEDVKTGYHSEIVKYLTVLIISIGAALALTIAIIYKNIKLKNKLQGSKK